ENLSKAATRFHYESNFELRITEHNLVSHEVAARESQTQAEGESALHDFFFGLKLTHRPILIPDGELPPATNEELAEGIRNARAAMEKSQPEVQKALREYGEAETLYQRGLDALARGSQQATEKAAAIQRELAPILATFEGHAQTRLENALRLLHQPELAERIAGAASLEIEADQLIDVFGRLAVIFSPLQEVRRKTEALTTAVQESR